MTGSLDPRTNAVRPDLAAKHLMGQVNAARFVEGEPVAINRGTAPMRQQPDSDAPLYTEALFGERAVQYDKNENWAWIQLDRDHYVGWVPLETVSKVNSTSLPTHRIAVPRSFCYPQPDLKYPATDSLPLNAEACVVNQTTTRGLNYAILANGDAIIASHLAPINDGFADDWVTVAQSMLGAPYLWAGRTPYGFDCSGLVQMARWAAGLDAPRDSDIQEIQCGEEIYRFEKDSSHLPTLKRGDLIFWSGHVAIMCDQNTMIHASGFQMQIVEENFEIARERIADQGLVLRTVRRF